ncbi:MAG: TetR/AcrR family transcriptional regulator [Luteibaculaceae bacterium]
MEENKCFIINKVLPLFMRFGIKSLTMDDIAKKLGVSKKTLYKHVDNKDILVEECLNEMLEQQDEQIRTVVLENMSAIEEHFNISSVILKSVKEVHPSVIYDLEKYYPSIFKKVLNAKNEMTYEIIISNLKRGIEEGLYRKNLNVEYIARVYIGSLNALFDPAVFPPDVTEFKESYKELLLLYLHGISTDKGKAQIENKQRELLELLKPAV